ncbi:hypothetical protein [Planococcus lenghuensis]|uniref:Uncharacterized protein n=1 Tax=Planococcus lenghuensis TaxID=2213202 RepID=A0A1Q2KYZ1_9BACL|nr:hypothetical protein [Planococcus lenghuensis]AQQ53344.1 hypothetical protein B0X71_09805 [Planococcus lenghuensis]
MKKAWVYYHFIAVLTLFVFVLFDFAINRGKSGNELNTHFTETALYVIGFNIFIAMPIWLIVLLFNKYRMDGKTFLKGLGLFFLFIVLAAWPVVTVIGYMAY